MNEDEISPSPETGETEVSNIERNSNTEDSSNGAADEASGGAAVKPDAGPQNKEIGSTAGEDTVNLEENKASSSKGACSSSKPDGGEVKFKKLKLSHRKYRDKSQEDERGKEEEDGSNAGATAAPDPAPDVDSDDSDDIINLVDQLGSSSSSSSTEGEETPRDAEQAEAEVSRTEERVERRMRMARRLFRLDMDSSESEPASDDEDQLRERRREQDSEQDSRIREQTTSILDKTAHKPNFNIIRGLKDYQRGQRLKQFQNNLYSSPSIVKRFELDCKLSGHEGCVNSLNFNATGSRIASGSDDLMIFVWDWEHRKKVTSFPTGHRENVFQSKFLPGDLLITSCSRDGQIRLAQLDPAGSLRSTSKLAQHKGPAHKMTLVQDTDYQILSAGEDGQVISVDIREQSSDKLLLLKNAKGRKVPIYSIHNNPGNSNQFCTAGREQYIRIFDRRYIGNAVQGEVVKYCPKHLDDSDKIKAYITAAVFSYNGDEVIGSYNDEDVYLFSTNQSGDTDFTQQYRGHRNNATVKGVNFYGQRSEYVISGSDCGNIFFWSKETGSIVNVIHGDESGVVNVLEAHPTLPILATSGLDEEVKVWRPKLQTGNNDSSKAKTKRNYIQKTIHKNLSERAMRSEDADPVYGHLLWQLWRNIRRGEQRRREAAAAADGDAAEQPQQDSDAEDSDDDDEDDEPEPPGFNCSQQ